MKILITILLFIMLGLSGCYTAKLNYTPDETIPIFSESPLIQYAISNKKMTYRLGFMKHKRERFKYIRKIESLNKKALRMYRSKTLTTEVYSGVCAVSCISLQLVTWFAILENSQGKQVEKVISKAEIQSLKSRAFADPEFSKILNASNLETEDGIAEFLKQIAELLEKVLNQ